MGAICVLKEFYEPDRDSVEYDIFFKYINNSIMYDCRLFYWICVGKWMSSDGSDIPEWLDKVIIHL